MEKTNENWTFSGLSSDAGKKFFYKRIPVPGMRKVHRGIFGDPAFYSIILCIKTEYSILYIFLYGNVFGLVDATQNDTLFNKLEENAYRQSGRIWIDEYRVIYYRVIFAEIGINKNWR